MGLGLGQALGPRTAVRCGPPARRWRVHSPGDGRLPCGSFARQSPTLCRRAAGEGEGGEKRSGKRRPPRGGSGDSAQPYPRPNPLTPHSCAHCAISYQILEACVSPRLEERLGTSSVAVESREVQRRPLVLPRGGDGHNPHAVSGGGGLAVGSSDPPHSHIARGPRRTLS